MGSKYCGKCGEQVDEAKAFCPGCGNAFVEEEKRTTVTEFEGSEKTVQLGQTMYNQLLSDMGLSIGKPPGQAEPKAEVIRPEPAVKPVEAEPRAEVIRPKPAVKPVEAEPKSEVIRPGPAVKPVEAEPPKATPAYVKWLIIAAVAVFGLAVLIILAAIAIIFYLAPRFA